MPIKEVWKCYGSDGLTPHADFTELFQVIDHLTVSTDHQVYPLIKAIDG